VPGFQKRWFTPFRSLCSASESHRLSCSIYNIGGDGQLIFGAVLAVAVAPWAAALGPAGLLVFLFVGFLGGGMVGALVGCSAHGACRGAGLVGLNVVHGRRGGQQGGQSVTRSLKPGDLAVHCISGRHAPSPPAAATGADRLLHV